MKFHVNSNALANYICLNGLPPKKASCKGHGYWVQAAISACGKTNPSPRLTKAVSNHWYKNVNNFRTNIIKLVR